MRGLADRLNATMDVVTNAVRFACFTQAIALGERAHLSLGASKLKRVDAKLLSEEPLQTIKHAERLGYWFGMAGSTRTVFEIMGLTA
jgi:hypothetical protein